MGPCGLLLVLYLSLSAAQAISEYEPNNPNSLSCNTDYNRRINCEWKSDQTDRCTVQAHKLNTRSLKFFVPSNSSCTLEPTGKPGLKTCSLLFSEDHRFKSYHVLSLKLSCVNMTESFITKFEPQQHIKLEAPGQPEINGSSLSWSPLRYPSQPKMPLEYELQWRPQDRPWTDAESKFISGCVEQCRTELYDDSMKLHSKYSSRLRVRLRFPTLKSMWSDWGPTASWDCLVGKTEEVQKLESDRPNLWTFVGGGAAFFTLIIVFIFFGTQRTRLHLTKIIKGQGLPNPSKSVLNMNWQSPPFSHEYYTSFFKPVDIITSVQLSPPSPYPRLASPLLEKSPGPSRPLSFNHSSFSNPMYPHLCPESPLKSCSVDSPPGPNIDPPSEEEHHSSGLGMDIMQFVRLTQQCQGVPVFCEYEKVEAVGCQGQQGEERVRLHSEDSGVGSGEEVSQESVLLEDTQTHCQTVLTHSPQQLIQTA